MYKPIKPQTMKLNQNSLMFLINKDNFGTFSQKESNELYKTDKLTLPESLNNLMNDNKNFRMLVLSNKVKNMIGSFIVPNELKFDVLRSLPNRKDIIMVDDCFVIKYIKTDNFVDMVFFTLDDKKEYLNYKFVQFDLIKNETFPKIDEKLISFYSENDIRDNGTWENQIVQMWKKFISIVTFLELIPTTLLVINGGEKRGDLMKGNQIKNESKSSVIQVNSNWNIQTIRLGGFDVCGHYRLMLVGKGRTRYEYVFIKPYQKGILRRLPQKMTIEPMTVEQLN